MKKEQQVINKSKRKFIERLVKSSAFAVPLVIGISSIKINTANASSNSCLLIGGQQSSSSSSLNLPTICINPSSSAILPASSSAFPLPSSSSSASNSSSSFNPQFSSSSQVNSIPEPSTLALLGLGIAGVALAKFKKDAKNTDTSEK